MDKKLPPPLETSTPDAEMTPGEWLTVAAVVLMTLAGAAAIILANS